MLNRPTINLARFLLLLRAPLFFEDPLFLSCALLDDRSGATTVVRQLRVPCCCTRRRLLRVFRVDWVARDRNPAYIAKECQILSYLNPIACVEYSMVTFFLDRLRIRVVKATRTWSMFLRRGESEPQKSSVL